MCIKRFLLLLAGTAAVFIGTRAYAFSDIPKNSRYADAFAYLEHHKIVKGFSDGTARPYDHLSRIEGLTSIIRSNEKFAPQIVWFSKNLPDISLFSDANQDDWYASYVEVGFLEGIITGSNNGKLEPANTLTIEQALVMIYRAYEEEDFSYRTTERLKNWPDQWFTEAVSMAHARNLIPQHEYLELGKPITRGQFFSILHRLHIAEKQNIYAYIEKSTINSDQRPATSDQRQISDQLSSPTKTPISFTINPLPFDPSDPFVLRLPPPSKTFGPERGKSIKHKYASEKEFAITIPSLDLSNVTIIHPDDPFSHNGILAPLKDGLGHLFSYPGNTGKIMIYGHSSSYPWDISEYTRIFRQINTLVAGERVYLTYEDTLYVYEVYRKQVVDASNASAFNDDGTSELILYTCWPPDSVKQRYLVHALPVEIIALR